MSDLTVITVVENDRGLLDLMIKSVRRFTTPAPKFMICDNGGSEKVLSIYKDDPDVTIVPHKPKMTGGSNRHGEGLNTLIKLVQTKRTAIIESDCIVLCDGWDKTSASMLAAPKGKHDDRVYYHACFMVFYTDNLRFTDFRAGTAKDRANRTYQPHEDVAWQVKAMCEVESLEFIDCKSGRGQYFGANFQSDEFWRDGKPTVAHFGRGSNIGGKAVRKGFKHPQEQLKDWKQVVQELLDDRHNG
jgi:hypothetical protein